MKTLRFSVGPVQEFVAQARRTRDFWAGSFLLSYLSAAAISAVPEREYVVFPSIMSPSVDPLIRAVGEYKPGVDVSSPPPIGTVPNQFQAIVPADFDPQACHDAVMRTWDRIAGAVWRAFIEPAASKGNNTRQIWADQVKSFWYVMWTVGDEQEGAALLDKRKNWRSHVGCGGCGDTCSMMKGLTEISGHMRSKSPSDADAQDAFWRAVRAQPGVSELDIQADERLSAIAVIKRLYPHVSKEVFGFDVPVSFPSTSYLSAIHWIADMAREQPDWCRRFADGTRSLRGTGSHNVTIKCLKPAFQEVLTRDFVRLDGGCYYDHTLLNERLWPHGTRDARKNLAAQLELANERSGLKPSQFYAVLAMDGDRMGALLRDYDPTRVSRAVNAFSYGVPAVVSDHNGITVYAGGDDVLILLPLEDAVSTARALRKQYVDSFRLHAPKVMCDGRATISAAVVFANHSLPLKGVLRDVHVLLEDKAKEESGRDSIAIAVHKSAGVTLTWATRWDSGALESLDKLTKMFDPGPDGRRRLTSGLLYKIDSTLFREAEAAAAQKIDFVPLIVAEYRSSREIEASLDEAREVAKEIISVCSTPVHSRSPGRRTSQSSIAPDGALLVRFIATRGVVQ